jgi:replicative DNA helicase
VSAVHLAERATLGALLLADSPDTVREIVAWLRPEDFLDPWHRDVHKVIRDRAAAGQSVNPHAVGIGLLDRVGPTRAALVRLTDLLRATPTHPDPRSYALMVLEAALRREVATLGVLLRAGALSTALDGTARPMLAVTATVDAGIEAIETRFGSASGVRAADSEPRPIGRHPRIGPRPVVEHALAADRLLRAHPAPTRNQTGQLEAGLIAALIARPHAIPAVRGWLRPDALIERGWAAVYTAVLDLADQHRPVDPVTVAWHTRDTPAAPSPDVIAARVESALPSDVGHLARRVAADHLRHRSDEAARAFSACAGDSTRALPEVLTLARASTARLRTAAAPLTGGTSQPSRAPGVHGAPSRRPETTVPQGRAG